MLFPKLASNEVRMVAKHADPNGQVDPLSHHVDRLIPESDIKVQAIVLLGQVQQGWDDVTTPEGGRQVNAQPSDGLLMTSRQERFCLIELLEDASAAQEVGFALARQVNAAGCPMQQLNTQPCLQLRDAFPDCRAGYAELCSCCGQTSFVDCEDKFADAYETIFHE